MAAQILKEIKARIEGDTRKPEQLYNELRGLGAQMVLTNTLTRDQVIHFCSAMISLYKRLQPKSE